MPNRKYWLLILSGFLLPLLFQGCTTSGGASGGEALSYDGSVDSMESLPDCGQDTQGSLFWVTEKNAGFDCTKSNEWKVNKKARKPDDEEKSDETEGVSPRIVR